MLFRHYWFFTLFIFFALGCETEPTNQELCEASATCEVSGSEDSPEFDCVEGMRWKDVDDPKSFDCVGCDDGYKWASSKKSDLHKSSLSKRTMQIRKTMTEKILAEESHYERG